MRGVMLDRPGGRFLVVGRVPAHRSGPGRQPEPIRATTSPPANPERFRPCNNVALTST